MEPICNFETQAKLDKCLEWWKNKLLLNDWIIKATIISEKDFELENSSGENLLSLEQKQSLIHIMDYSDGYSDTSLTKFCQEKILVHELLHCKYNFILPNDSYESKFLDVMDHQQLDLMSKSLIMVKYNIPFEWFKNDKISDNRS